MNTRCCGRPVSMPSASRRSLCLVVALVVVAVLGVGLVALPPGSDARPTVSAYATAAAIYNYDSAVTSTPAAVNPQIDELRSYDQRRQPLQVRIAASRPRLAAEGGGRFAPGKWLTHFEKHGAEFGYKNSVEYLQGARSLIGRHGVQTYTRTNGDRLFYDAATNEFAATTKDGVIRTYFRPDNGSAYWQGQIGG
jgi:pyocin large subunit-like protein